jgi:hypothetical protein
MRNKAGKLRITPQAMWLIAKPSQNVAAHSPLRNQFRAFDLCECNHRLQVKGHRWLPQMTTLVLSSSPVNSLQKYSS